ncbi:MAG: FtsQ-type POTRA domain-containing protein [Bacillota bacterium]
MKLQRNFLERVCIVLLLLCTGIVLLNSPFFSIRRVVVEGNKLLTAKEITNAAGIPLGANIFRVNLREASARVETIPAVKEARLSRRLPGEVVVRVIEREAIALVSGGDGFYGFDEAGVCIGRLPAASALPVVTGVGRAPPVGERLSTRSFKTAAAVLQAFDGRLISFLAEVHVTPAGTVEVYTATGVKIYLGRPEKLSEKGLLLSRILETVGSREVLYIDLKVAERPVVRFAGKQEEEDAGKLSDVAGGGALLRTADRATDPSVPGN